jgi:3-deoxy-D-manno-octulosonic acid kinase
MHPTEKQLENQYIIYDSSIVEDVAEKDFDIGSYRASNAVLGEASGRGTTYFVKREKVPCVLRHYHRGGMMAKLTKDRYWWSGIYNTRSWREWYLLVKLKDWDLPVPRAIAASAVRKGLFYTADLLMEKIEDSEPLSSKLVKQKLDDSQWRRIGSTLRRFHQRGVYHADLNAHNILLDSECNVYVIDFDKCQLRETQRSWQLANLNRLQRSLNKIKQEDIKVNFELQDWELLVSGYTQL